MKRFAFVMDPLEKLDLPWDTSLCLLRKLHARGHETFLFLPASLSLDAIWPVSTPSSFEKIPLSIKVIWL